MQKRIIITRASISPEGGWDFSPPEEVGIWPMRPGLVAFEPIIIDPDPLVLDTIGRELFRAGKIPYVVVGVYDRSIPWLCYLPLSRFWLDFSLDFFAAWTALSTYAEDIAHHSLARGKFGANRKFVEAVAKAYHVHFSVVLHRVMAAVLRHREEICGRS